MMKKVRFPKIPGEFVNITQEMIHSENWGELSMAAQAVYLQMKASFGSRVFRGAECNSSYREIKFGFKDMRGKITKGVYYRAIKELIEYSFVKIVNKGSSNKVQFGENRVNIENEKMVKKTTVYDLLREGKNAQ